MSDAMLLAGMFVSAYWGFACLALNQGRHWQQVTGRPFRPDAPVRTLRAASVLLLSLAFLLALKRDGLEFGSLLWATTISLAAICVALTLTWRPAWLRLALFRRPVQ